MMTNEYVYSITAPALTDMLLPGVEEKLFINTDRITYKSVPAKTLIKEEFLTWNNIEWQQVLIFHKTNNFIGRLHVDSTDKLAWGINWIYSGVGTLKYWEKSQIKSSISKVDEEGYLIYVYKTDELPAKEYNLTIGTYLVNASIPHLPSGNNGRYAFSLRPGKFDMTWEEVKTKFQHLML